jgi:hypothetical protein
LINKKKNENLDRKIIDMQHKFVTMEKVIFSEALEAMAMILEGGDSN